MFPPARIFLNYLFYGIFIGTAALENFHSVERVAVYLLSYTVYTTSKSHTSVKNVFSALLGYDKLRNPIELQKS
jgi:hypothetical protein